MEDILHHDQILIAALPSGGEVVSVDQHGTANWSMGFKLDVEVAGEEKEYFLKVFTTEVHAEMALGEFESQMAMARFIPENVSIPIAHGTFELDTTKSFLLSPFRVLTNKTASSSHLADVLSKLHKQSFSPTGRFGFHVKTFNGVVPIITDWCDTWEEFFSRQLRSDIEWEHSIRGSDPEFDAVAAEFFQKVVPRLLRPLETEGRAIKPSLVHGDLYHGNCQIDIESQKVIFFDSCCCYAHNEMDLQMMRQSRYRFGTEHLNKYKEYIQPSEPVEEFDDRNCLYAMHDDIINAGLHSHRAYLRNEVKKEMLRLLAKYPAGYTGPSTATQNMTAFIHNAKLTSQQTGA